MAKRIIREEARCMLAHTVEADDFDEAQCRYQDGDIELTELMDVLETIDEQDPIKISMR